MLRIRNLSSRSSFILAYFLLMLLFWAGLNIRGHNSFNINVQYAYSFGINTTAFLGGVFGVIVSKKWGGVRSALGLGILFISLGLISWGAIGGYIWSYYNIVLQQEVPYPSFSDVGFIAAVPLWAIGMLYFAKATGAKYGLRKTGAKLSLLIWPLITFSASYYFLVTVARDGTVSDGGSWVKVFFDFAYPIGDLAIITISLAIFGLTMKLLGGLYKWPVRIVLLGFIVMFFADMAFSYSTTVDTYYNGNYADLLFTIALFLMGFGISRFDTKALK